MYNVILEKMHSATAPGMNCVMLFDLVIYCLKVAGKILIIHLIKHTCQTFKNKPGPLGLRCVIFPSLKMTARSYSFTVWRSETQPLT